MARSTFLSKAFGLVTLVALAVLVATAVRRPWAPHPRVDLLIPYGVLLASLLAWWATGMRDRPRRDTDGAATAPPLPRRVPGRWRQGVRIVAVFTVAAVLVVFGSIIGDTPSGADTRRVQEMIRAGAVIQDVKVLEVRSTSRHGSRHKYYVSTLVLALPDASGTTHRVLVPRAVTCCPVRPGEEVEAFYSPRRPEAGAFVHDGELEQFLGRTPANLKTTLVLAAAGYVILALLLLVAFRSDWQRSRRLRAALRAGQARAVRGRVKAPAACRLPASAPNKSEHIRGCLLVETPASTVRFQVWGDAGNLHALARDLRAAPAWLCWAPPDQRSDDSVTVLLVSDDGYALWGEVEVSEMTPLARQRGAAGPTLTGERRMRSAASYVFWDPQIHSAGAWLAVWYLVAVGCWLVTSPSNGAWESALVLTVVAAPVAVPLLWLRRRRKLVRALLPPRPDPEDRENQHAGTG